jgi:O-antigen ligase
MGAMTPLAPRISPARSAIPAHAKALFGLASLILVLMPLAMWLQSRSSTGMLAAAAMVCFLATWQAGELPRLRQRVAETLEAPAAVFMLLLLAFALVSLTWSHNRIAGLIIWLELVIPLVSGLIVALTWPAHAPRWAILAFVAALLIALALTCAELAGWLQWRGQVGLRTNSFVFNRTMIFMLMMVGCLLALAVLRGQWSRMGFPVGAVLFLYSMALERTDSGAVILGTAVVALAFVCTWLLPKLSLAALAAGMVVLAALAPVQGEISDRLLPAKAHVMMADSHSRDRVDIWQSFGEAIRQRPLTGAGFGTSGSFAQHPVALQVPEARRVLLGAGHPHAMQVQVWAEMGVAGAALLLMAGLALVGVLWRLPHRLRAVATAMTAGALAIAAVGHGAWQGWWIATLAVSCCWIALAAHQQAHGLNASRP